MIRTMSRFALSLGAAALLVSTLASCGSDLLQLDTQWTLQSVEGADLPFIVTGTEHDVVITSGTASLNSDNTYVTTFTGTSDGVAGTVGTDSGHWSVSHSEFIFHSTTLGTDYIAAIVGSTFHVTLPGAVVNSSDQGFDMVFAKGQ